MTIRKILFSVVAVMPLGLYAGDCERSSLLKDFKAASHVVVGIGESSNKDQVSAKKEAKTRAFQDIVSQLTSNVESTMNLSETDKTTGFDSAVSVNSNIDDIKGVKFFKEAKQKNTFCSVYTLDLNAAYEDAQGHMRVLDKKLSDVMDAQAKKKYVEVIRLYDTAKYDLKINENNIIRADVYKTYLKKGGTSWIEKFKTAEVDLDKTVNEAKNKISFYIIDFPKYEDVALDTESLISSQGYNVQVGGEKPATGIMIEFKESGIPRKAKTALGFTMVYKFAVVLKDIETGRTLGSNKGATVQGFSKNDSEDEALASAAAQMSLNVMEVLKTAVPGLIKE